MFRVITRIVAALAMASVCIPVFGQVTPGDVTRFGSVGEWTVLIDHKLKGCSLYGEWNNGVRLRIGFDSRNSNGYLMFGHPSWRSLRDGHRYQLGFQFGSKASWDGDGYAWTMEGDPYHYLTATFTKPGFLAEFVAGPDLTVTRAGRIVTQIELEGTEAAVVELIRCQKETGYLSADPFEPDSRPSTLSPADDPFAT